MASEEDEFAVLFHEFYPGLCRFIACLLGGRGASGIAQDIAQESFLQLHRAGFRSLPEGEARFWLYRVARNFALNELNRGNTRQRLVGRVVDVFRAHHVPTPEEEFELAERKDLLVDMLGMLPEQQCAALLLREQEEMSYREIASVLNVSESKVKVDVFRARTFLRARWGNRQKALARSSSQAG